MATLNIRNLPDPVHARLRLRAARGGRSMEAEARAILSDACRPASSDAQILALQDLVDRLYGENKPAHVVDELIAERRQEARQE